MSPTDSTAFADAATTRNRRFEGDDYLFGTEPNSWLMAHAGVRSPGERVLCVGASARPTWPRAAAAAAVPR